MTDESKRSKLAVPFTFIGILLIVGVLVAVTFQAHRFVAPTLGVFTADPTLVALEILANAATPPPNVTAEPTDEAAFRQSVALARTPVASNADWTPVEHRFDRVVMVLVPTGCFAMGSTDRNANEDEQPVHEQCFNAPFWIDKTEVTNAQYGSVGRYSGDNYPRESVDWFAAQEHCLRRGARLPTEREWEYAARGPDALVYPWGSEFVADNVVHAENSGGQTTPVATRPDGASWVGALDMSGSVWEWMTSVYDPYPYAPNDGREELNRADDHLRVVRGGSWSSAGADFLRSADRGWSDPTFDDHLTGFRCARDVE